MFDKKERLQERRKIAAKSRRQTKKATDDVAKAVAFGATMVTNPVLGLGLVALGSLGKKKKKRRKKKGLF